MILRFVAVVNEGELEFERCFDGVRFDVGDAERFVIPSDDGVGCCIAGAGLYASQARSNVDFVLEELFNINLKFVEFKSLPKIVLDHVGALKPLAHRVSVSVDFVPSNQTLICLRCPSHFQKRYSIRMWSVKLARLKIWKMV